MSDMDPTEGIASMGQPWAGKRLFEARTIVLVGEINNATAERVTSQLLALAADSKKPIRMFLHSNGGHVESGDTIHDMIRVIEPRVLMIGTGWVASAGVHIYLAAAKEDRFCLPNTRFMIHQPLGGIGGRAVDIQIEADEILKMRERLNRTISEATGQAITRVRKDTDRNFWMSPEEATDYGIVGRVVSSLSELPG